MSVENHPGFTMYCLIYSAILKKPSPVRLYTKNIISLSTFPLFLSNLTLFYEIAGDMLKFLLTLSLTFSYVQY